MRALTLLGCLFALHAGAQVPDSCDAPHDVDKYQLLRRLSLDLRGRLPSYEEYQALDAVDTVPASTIAAFLGTDDFRVTMRKYHEALLWPNVSNVSLSAGNANLNTQVIGSSTVFLSSSGGRANGWRGSEDLVTTAHGKDCGDFEQTHFDAAFPGEFRPDPAFIYTEVQDSKTMKQEGWRLVHPYWDPDPKALIKVCAFEAQETLTAQVQKKTTSCGDATANGKPECGCGPNLRFCYGPNQQVATVITAALREQLGRKVDEVTTGGRPYTELLLSTTADQNGPIAFWKRNLASNYSYARVYTVADLGEELAPLDFTDSSWKTTERGGLHAGVLTLPGYLLRFQTNRGRANRARIDFECEAFVPPAQLESPSDGCSADGSDLTGRCTCRYCHRTLEPIASHFGQFAEAGTTFLAPSLFPRTNPACVGVTSGACGRFYVTNPDADHPGSLLPYQYADSKHPENQPALDGGPRRYASGLISSGVFARCAVKRVFSNYLKRDMHVAGDTVEELPTLTSLSDGFAANGYSLSWLVGQVVSLPQYRSLR
jgi:hypothetical protein